MRLEKGYSSLRRGRIYDLGGTYHLVFSTENNVPYFQDFLSARQVIKALSYSDEQGWSSTIAFVVMPDHVHWLVQSVSKTPDKLVSSIKRHVSKNSIPKVFWNRGYYDSFIRDERQLLHTARYIIANPKRAFLVTAVGMYPHWDCIYINP